MRPNDQMIFLAPPEPQNTWSLQIAIALRASLARQISVELLQEQILVLASWRGGSIQNRKKERRDHWNKSLTCCGGTGDGNVKKWQEYIEVLVLYNSNRVAGPNREQGPGSTDRNALFQGRSAGIHPKQTKSFIFWHFRRKESLHRKYVKIVLGQKGIKVFFGRRDCDMRFGWGITVREAEWAKRNKFLQSYTDKITKRRVFVAAKKAIRGSSAVLCSRP